MADPHIGTESPPKPTLTSVSDHITEVDDRLSYVHRNVSVITNAGLVASIVFALSVLALVFFIHSNGQRITDVDTARITDEAHRAAEIRNIRNVGCLLVGTLEDAYSTYSRDTWPGGPGDYDDALKRVMDASAILKCEQ